MAEHLYHICEIFPSLQGEGEHSGMAALFVRFAGCNLQCSFCDTDFSARLHLTLRELISAIREYSLPNVILTGGEPTLQIDSALIAALHEAGLTIHIETNGTRSVPEGIDWITCSPKSTDASTILLQHADEVKVVFQGQNLSEYNGIIEKLQPHSLRLQPCDTGDAEKNEAITRECIKVILSHPRWRLSLQTHKLLGIR